MGRLISNMKTLAMDNRIPHCNINNPHSVAFISLCISFMDIYTYSIKAFFSYHLLTYEQKKYSSMGNSQPRGDE